MAEAKICGFEACIYAEWYATPCPALCSECGMLALDKRIELYEQRIQELRDAYPCENECGGMDRDMCDAQGLSTCCETLSIWEDSYTTLVDEVTKLKERRSQGCLLDTKL
jgi:hypothetical protein